MAPVGRPTVMTPSVLDKLAVAFSLGCSDVESCYFSGISIHSLYKYQEKHPEFKEVKARLKQRPVFLARSTLLKGIQRDPKLALKFLERVKKDEFSLKTEVKVQGQGQVAAVFRWNGEPARIEVPSPLEVGADEVLVAITDAVDAIGESRDAKSGSRATPDTVYVDGALHNGPGLSPLHPEPRAKGSSAKGGRGEGPTPNGLSVDPSTQNSQIISDNCEPKPTEPDSATKPGRIRPDTETAQFNIVFPK